eukprot:1482107-Amphidinium_carterae.1
MYQVKIKRKIYDIMIGCQAPAGIPAPSARECESIERSGLSLRFNISLLQKTNAEEEQEAFDSGIRQWLFKVAQFAHTGDAWHL